MLMEQKVTKLLQTRNKLLLLSRLTENFVVNLAQLIYDQNVSKYYLVGGKVKTKNAFWQCCKKNSRLSQFFCLNHFPLFAFGSSLLQKNVGNHYPVKVAKNII